MIASAAGVWIKAVGGVMPGDQPRQISSLPGTQTASRAEESNRLPSTPIASESWLLMVSITISSSACPLPG